MTSAPSPESTAGRAAPVASSTPLALEVSGLHKAFGGVQALDGVDLAVPSGSLSGLIGPNGAGKTTLFNVITGLIPPDSGTVLAQGADVTGLQPYRIARAGIARTFQTPRGFASMTVLQNLALAEHSRGEGIVGGFVRGRRVQSEVLDRAGAILERLGIDHLANSAYGELSGGELRLLEISRHLMHEIDVLLLDEPTAGVIPAMQERLADVVRDLVSSGITVVIVEHNLSFVFQLASNITVMVRGRVLCCGTPSEIQEHPEVISAYLGATQDLPE